MAIDRKKEEQKVNDFLRSIGIDIQGLIVSIVSFKRQSIINALRELPPFVAINGRIFPIHPQPTDSDQDIAARLVAAANPDPVGVAARVIGQIVAPNPDFPFQIRLPKKVDLFIGGKPINDQSFRNITRG